jgi:hypothetical protein
MRSLNSFLGAKIHAPHTTFAGNGPEWPVFNFPDGSYRAFFHTYSISIAITIRIKSFGNNKPADKIVK